jgi:uncharacterized membrane protein YraQ (UPF0718 family)/copper chaperone CopZ
MLDAVLGTFMELSPWLLLGMGIAGILHVALPKNFVRKQLRGRGGVARAVAIGVPLPLCSCGVIPTGLGLKKDGASDGAAIGFLISTPQTGVDSILVSASFLGWPFALFKVVSAALTGLVGGWLVDETAHREPDHDEDASLAAETDDEDRNLRGALAHGFSLLEMIWRWLVFGVLVSAAIQVFVPADSFSVLADLGSIGASAAVLLFSLPLYVCATASVPIAAALVESGMPTGAALVFLMAGPATNVATIGAVHRAFGGRSLAIYLATIIAGSIILGGLFDAAIDVGLVSTHIHHEQTTWWAIASTTLLLAMISFLAFKDARRLWQTHRPGAGGALLELPIAGLRCGACVNKLEGALRDVEGVRSAVVTREPDRATLRGSFDRDAIEAAIVQAGFQVG